MARRIHSLLLVLMVALAGCSGEAPPNSRAPTPDPRLPYPIPGSCAQTNAHLPSDLPESMTTLTRYWIGEAGIFAGYMDKLTWHTGDNAVTWFSRDGQPQVSMRLIEGRKRSDAVLTFAEATPPFYRSTINIPLGGCWEVSASTPNHQLIFIVFAYPEHVIK